MANTILDEILILVMDHILEKYRIFTSCLTVSFKHSEASICVLKLRVQVLGATLNSCGSHRELSSLSGHLKST